MECVASLWLMAMCMFSFPIGALSGTVFCDGRVAQPVVRGSWDSPIGQFLPEAGCKYRVWDAPPMQGCMGGSQLVLMGGSNLIQINIQLLQMLGVDTTLDIIMQLKDGAFGVADMIIEGEAISYLKTTHTAIDKDSLPALELFLDQAPEPAQGIRITVIRANFWSKVDPALDLLEYHSNAWSNAPLSLITEIGHWYVYCAENKADWCPYKEVVALSKTEAQNVFQIDMRRNMRRMSKLCAENNRGSVHGCTVMSPHYTGGGIDNGYKRYGDLTEEIVKDFQGDHLRYLDLWAFTEPVKNKHMQRGHMDPISSTWLWNILFSGACAAFPPAGGSSLSFSGALCSAADFVGSDCKGAQASECPPMVPLCQEFIQACSGWCPKEICQHSLPCKVAVTCSSNDQDCAPAAELPWPIPRPTPSPTPNNPTPSPSPSASGCYLSDCGCPPFSSGQSWCNDNNAIMTGWCAESSGNCNNCNGVYCGSTSGFLSRVARHLT